MAQFQVYAFADEADPSLTGQVAAMKRNGLAGLEIRNVDGRNVSDLTPEQAQEVRRRLDDAGLITWSIGSPIGKIHIVNDDFAAHLEKLKHTLEIANILGAQHLRLFSFYLPEGCDPAAYKNEVIDRMGAMATLAAGSGVLLCHENEKGIYGDTADRCLDIFKAVSLLRAVFDPANFVQCGEDTRQAWQLLYPYVCYLHIKDATADGPVVPAGEGDGNIPYLLEEYHLQGGTAVTLEPHLSDFVGLGALEREGEKSLVGGRGYPSQEAAFDAGVAAFNKLL